MNKEKLTKNLQQIKVLADECLKEIGIKNARPGRKTTKPSVSINPRMTLPKHILALRENQFFKQLKTALEVHTKLQPIYPCDINRVEVALVRLRKSGKLRKGSKLVKGKRLVAYVW